MAESGFGFQPGYSPVKLILLASASSKTDCTTCAKDILAVSTEERISMYISIFPSPPFTMARLLEVSTVSGMESIILMAPFGQALMALIRLYCTFTGITFCGRAVSSAKRVRVGSLALNSALKISSYSFTLAKNLSALAAGTVTIPKASRGMAFLMFPPDTEERRRSSSLLTAFKKRKYNLLAFPLPKLMSIPE